MEDNKNLLTMLDVLPISSWTYPRILLGIPLERSISHADEVFFPFMKIATQGPVFIEGKYGRTDVVRNQMVKELLLSTYTHLLMLDVDHNHPSNIIQHLAKWVLLYGDEVPVICGLNFRRKAPYDPVAGILSINGARPLMVEWDKGLMQVDECGAASLLVSRSVFEQMEPPWFANIYDDVWNNNWPGEDIYFARKCKKLDIPFFVDTTLSSPHATTSMITEQTFRNYMEAHPEEFKDVKL